MCTEAFKLFRRERIDGSRRRLMMLILSSAGYMRDKGRCRKGINCQTCCEECIWW